MSESTRQMAAAADAARHLLYAYERGEARGGAVEWEDLDLAVSTAREAFDADELRAIRAEAFADEGAEDDEAEADEPSAPKIVEPEAIAGAAPSWPAPPTIPLAHLTFEPSGPEANPRARLLATIKIGPTHMHLEAYEITEDDQGVQRAVVYDEDVEKVYAGVNAEGGWQTTEIDGKEYVVIATPFCK
jgi:hypothetical protein